MKRRFVVFTMTAILCLALLGCSGANEPTPEAQDTSSSETQASETNEPKDIEVVESGWSFVDGYVFYAVKMKNPNTNLAADLPTVTITGKDVDGKILFSEESYVTSLPPNSLSYTGGQAGNGNAPATVDFSVNVGAYGWTPENPQEEEAFTITNTNEVVGDYMTNYTGEITMNYEHRMSTNARITVVLRDADGNITGGYHGLLLDLTVGKSTPFDVTGYADIPHTSFEIAATH